VERSCVGMLDVVATSGLIGRRRCSLTDFRYLSPWRRFVRRWVRRGPHAMWPGSVVALVPDESFLSTLGWSRGISGLMCAA
jgi:hypothetical protein